MSSMAFDRSARSYDENGHLHVRLSNITKANVCPYRGAEIPNSESLGLDPDAIYQLYRDPEELRKAAASFHGVPLLIRHRSVSADDHPHDLVVGSVGNDTTFDAPFLRASLTVWDAAAIAAIETRAQQELSSSYRYDADMTPGEIGGVKYDGVMRNIRGNHVALVEAGRAGSDVLVADERLNYMPKAALALSGKAALVKGALAASLRPVLAQDQRIDLTPIVASVTAKNWAEKKPSVVAALRRAAEGKLAADASLDDVVKMLDCLDDEDVPERADDAVQVGALTAEELAQIRQLIGGDRKAADAEKEDDDKEKKKDDEPEKPKGIDKKAMDSALADAEKRIREEHRAIREAETAVRPFVGEVAAMDSAAEVYAFALEKLGVDVEGVSPTAYPKLLELAGAKHQAETAPARFANDAALAASGKSAFSKRFPEASSVRVRH